MDVIAADYAGKWSDFGGKVTLGAAERKSRHTYGHLVIPELDS